MALTLYLAHVLTGILPFYLDEESRGAPSFDRPFVLLWWAAWCMAAFWLASRWDRNHSRGPAEALFRRLGG